MGEEIFGLEDILWIQYEKIIKEYIRNQLKDDYMSDQISIEEYIDSFTGEPKKKK